MISYCKLHPLVLIYKISVGAMKNGISCCNTPQVSIFHTIYCVSGQCRLSHFVGLSRCFSHYMPQLFLSWSFAVGTRCFIPLYQIMCLKKSAGLLVMLSMRQRIVPAVFNTLSLVSCSANVICHSFLRNHIAMALILSAVTLLMVQEQISMHEGQLYKAIQLIVMPNCWILSMHCFWAGWIPTWLDQR